MISARYAGRGPYCCPVVEKKLGVKMKKNELAQSLFFCFWPCRVRASFSYFFPVLFLLEYRRYHFNILQDLLTDNPDSEKDFEFSDRLFNISFKKCFLSWAVPFQIVPVCVLLRLYKGTFFEWYISDINQLVGETNMTFWVPWWHQNDLDLFYTCYRQIGRGEPSRIFFLLFFAPKCFPRWKTRPGAFFSPVHVRVSTV